ncbi:MAG: hypothetical protein Ct9H300mP16_14720 [Pseudomonadota bacterium]|nr:MAG: hypothetical protein Ct9H300mP16_14720 [Pseudomonadota bacterium]
MLTADSRSDGGSLVWSKLSRRERRDPVLTAIHVRSLIDSGSMKQAEKILRKAIDRNWNGDLIRLYGHVRSVPIQSQLEHAIRWRKSHPDDPDLLMTLARLQLELKAATRHSPFWLRLPAWGSMENLHGTRPAAGIAG